MTSTSPPRPVSGRDRVGTSPRAAYAVLLAVVWLAWAVMAWQGTVREVDADRLRDDAGAERVVGFAVAEWLDDDGRWPAWLDARFMAPPPAGPSDTSTSDPGLLVVYRVDSPVGPVRYVDTLSPERRDELLDTLASAGAREVRLSTFSVRDGGVTGIGVLGMVLAAGWVLWGPTLTRGSRWFWGILVVVLPAGLGLILLAWLEVWRPRPDVPGRPARPRSSGLVAVGYGIVAAFPWAVLLWGLHAALGDVVVPF